eukprot:CAMPEP_0178755148 /NCGR_PEP_ID=MMETSP0744-20121128/12557_1 /TAXON_ID=913974 /ORGANISM="Nitzschia punctata, Strain CCMP561" /LENGTH=178 /DNA_ID=CAMNT_0020409145 /DNA_START=333 /DNA_END=866 /DNA_ORIENTATION=+
MVKTKRVPLPKGNIHVKFRATTPPKVKTRFESCEIPIKQLDVGDKIVGFVLADGCEVNDVNLETLKTFLNENKKSDDRILLVKKHKPSKTLPASASVPSSPSRDKLETAKVNTSPPPDLDPIDPILLDQSLDLATGCSAAIVAAEPISSEPVATPEVKVIYEYTPRPPPPGAPPGGIW